MCYGGREIIQKELLERGRLHFMSVLTQELSICSLAGPRKRFPFYSSSSLRVGAEGVSNLSHSHYSIPLAEGISEGAADGAADVSKEWSLCVLLCLLKTSVLRGRIGQTPGNWRDATAKDNGIVFQFITNCIRIDCGTYKSICDCCCRRRKQIRIRAVATLWNLLNKSSILETSINILHRGVLKRGNEK